MFKLILFTSMTCFIEKYFLLVCFLFGDHWQISGKPHYKHLNGNKMRKLMSDSGIVSPTEPNKYLRSCWPLTVKSLS